MYALLVLVALALGLSVIRRALQELVPVPVPAALTRTAAIALGAGLAWMLDYSVFAAFGQDVRAEWMHPVFTGLVLVALGEFLAATLNAVARRPGETPVDAAAPSTPVRAA